VPRLLSQRAQLLLPPSSPPTSSTSSRWVRGEAGEWSWQRGPSQPTPWSSRRTAPPPELPPSAGAGAVATRSDTADSILERLERLEARGECSCQRLCFSVGDAAPTLCAFMRAWGTNGYSGTCVD
jgi:hypothetical protein